MPQTESATHPREILLWFAEWTRLGLKQGGGLREEKKKKRKPPAVFVVFRVAALRRAVGD